MELKEKLLIKELIDKFDKELKNEDLQYIFDNLERFKYGLYASTTFYHFLKDNCHINPLEYMTDLPNLMFLGDIKLYDINIPNNIKSIGSNCFANCTLLTKVILPTNPNFVAIPKGCFYACKSLEEIYIPNNIVELKPLAFRACYSLKELHLPSSIKSIGHDALGINNKAKIYCSKNIDDIEFDSEKDKGFFRNHLIK